MTDIDEPQEIIPGVMTRKELQNSRSRLRNWITRDAANSEKRARNLAAQLLATADNNYLHRNRDEKMRADALITSVGNLASRVLVSMNVTARVNVSHGSAKYSGKAVQAYTDFNTINIQVDPSSFNTSSVESISELIHVVKGLVYHEGGHVAWTTPMSSLCDRIGCSRNHDIDGKQYPLVYMQQSWNVLEDQRMERAMVVTSPIMAKYFTTIVAKYAIDPELPGLAWPWLVGRTYLPRELRRAVRAEAERMEAAHLIPRMESAILAYCNASDARTMHDAVIEMHICLMEWLSSNNGKISEIDRHSALFKDDKKSSQDIPAPPMPMELDSDNDQGDGDGTPSDADGDTGENEGKEDGESDSDQDSLSKSAGDGVSDKSIKEQLEQIVNQNVSSTNINEVNEVMADINTSRSMMAIRDDTIKQMNNTEVTLSTEVRNRMLDVLDRLVVQVDPSWMFYQDNGVLDPTAYTTREPGDMNFWSGMDGDKGNGHDLAVSLLIDSSGSMGNEIENVSIIAMGIRKACEHYDIPCTITTFSEDVRLIAAGDEECDFVKVEAGGGTQVFDAMTILDDQRYGKHNHLVVILTDGEWSDLRDVRIWGTPTRHIMIVGYNVDHAIIADKGANSAITISNINELAPLVTNSLAGYFGS